MMLSMKFWETTIQQKKMIYDICVNDIYVFDDIIVDTEANKR